MTTAAIRSRYTGRVGNTKRPSRNDDDRHSEGEFGISGLVPDTPILLQPSLAGSFSDLVTVQVVPGTERTGVLQMRR